MPTYSYSGDPSTSSKDQVRFLLNDKGPDTWLLSDEEIAWSLTQDTNVFMAAALNAEQIASYYSSRTDKTIGPLTIRNGDKAQSYTSLARRLRIMAGQYAKGVAVVMTQSSQDHIFVIGITDYPGSQYPFDPDAPPLASLS